jgi:guanosine-3',5'-bis(diphosphate) 3'-pyrophosphohydrolase
LWQRAASYAAWAHRHQVRKDGRTPYVAHVFRVAMTVSQVFGHGDETTAAVALLHDTIEDTTTDYEDLERRFGAVVADGVALLTKNMALPEPRREAAYDAQLAGAPWWVKLVKLADVYDNVCDVDTSSPEHVAERRRDALEKCRRAVVLARGDASAEPTLLKAAALVEALVAREESAR